MSMSDERAQCAGEAGDKRKRDTAEDEGAQRDQRKEKKRKEE